LEPVALASGADAVEAPEPVDTATHDEGDAS